MAADGVPLVNECLCFINCKFNKIARSDLSAILFDFYTVEEIVLAKKTLHDFATSINVNNVPSYIERKGNNRQRASVDDLLTLYALLDVHKVKLPVYVAANPLRLPGFTVPTKNAAVDEISALAALVYELRDQVSSLTNKLDELRVHCHLGGASGGNSANVGDQGGIHGAGSANGGTGINQGNVGCQSAAPIVIRPVVQGPQPSTLGQSTPATLPLGGWASKAAALASADDPFSNAMRPALIRGKRSTESVKSVPRQLTCFVGRLDPNTTDESLRDFLAEAGIEDVECKKLVAKNGRVFKTAAFRVSCRAEFRDLFYNEESWPEGAELRDWVFRRNGAVQ